MRKVKWASVLVLLVGHNGFAITFREAYRSALNTNEDISSQAETVKQAELRYAQAKGALFPTVNAIGTYAKQDEPPQGTASNISPSEQKTVRLNATQPLFRGMREWALLKQQKTGVEAAELDREQVLLKIYSDIALNFYLSMMAEQDYKNLQTALDVNRQRLDELQNFRKLGRSRASEVLSQEAYMATLDAQLDLAKYTVENSRAALALLTGVSRQTVLADDENFPKALPPKESFLLKADTRPDVRAAQKRVDSSDQGIDLAKGGHLPSLDLSGNYYFLRPNGFLRDVKWDVTLGLTFPIFQGGIVKSATEIAVSQMKQSELNLAKTKRAAREEIETLYGLLVNDFSQVQKQKKAADLNEKNYQAERKDYRNGLVNNIEVLSSLISAQDTRRNLDKIQYQFKIDYLRLVAATAESASAFEPSDKTTNTQE